MGLGDWEITISGGNTQLLRDLSQRSSGNKGYFRIWGGINDYLDCYDDNFSFTSVFFLDNDCDDEIAWQYAYTLLALFNGFLSMHIHNHSNFTVSGIYKKNTPLPFRERKYIMALMGCPDNPNPTLANKRAIDPIFLAIEFATTHIDIYILLMLFEQGITLSNLYRILESIEEFSKEHKIIEFAKKSGKEFNVNRDQRSKFTNTANNFSISSFDARHGFKRTLKQNNTLAMSNEEAYKFVSKVARDYLYLRLNQITMN